MSNLTDAIIAAKLIGAQGGGSGGGSGLPEIERTEIELFNDTMAFAQGGSAYSGAAAVDFSTVVGQQYAVTWDSVPYTCTAVDIGSGFGVVGNLAISGAGEDTGEPFVGYAYEGTLILMTASTAASHAVKIDSEIQTPPDGYVLGVDGGEWKAVPSGGSGLPSTTYYIMGFEPTDDDAADLLFYRPNGEDRDLAMFSTVRVERDTETRGYNLKGFGPISPNPEADPPITDADIAAMKLKLASWSNASYGGDAWYQLITGEVYTEFYVYPYIL